MDFAASVQHARDGADANNVGSDGDNTDVAQSTKSLIAEADRAIQSCNEVLRDQLEKVGRKVPTEKTVAVIYTAYCAISASGSQADFLAERQIKVHGSTKNECYPIFRAFTRTAHPWLRDRVCKYAQVAALAVHEKVPPEAFPDWLKCHPIEKACREYRRITREQAKSERNEHLQRVWQFLVDPRKDPEKAPILPATPITPGYVGLKLAVLDFSHDGSGEFRVLGIMPHDADAVMRMALTAANKGNVDPILVRSTEMSTIDSNDHFAPGAAFMESAAMDLEATTRFLVDNADVASKLNVVPGGAVQYTATVDVFNPDLTAAFKLALHMVIDPPVLASEIVKASSRGKLRLEGFQVVDGFFTQPRLVLLIRRRVVGQLYCSRDGRSLQLDIRERPDARDMGNAVLALGCLPFNVHTPLGSAPADRMH